MLIILISSLLCTTIHAEETWITIIVHGAIGLAANLSGHTINLIKKDCIEGSTYEKNVSSIRENRYLFALSPTGKLGMHKVAPHAMYVDAAHIFSELYTDIAHKYQCAEKNTFYTYGWSGLISKKRRIQEAREFYCSLRDLIKHHTKNGKAPKVRIIGYSYAPIMFLNFAELRKEEFKNDTFMIEQTIFIGTPINKTLESSLCCPLFKKIYLIYSRGDKIQRFDIFSGNQMMSHRYFKKSFPNLTQIEFKVTAHLKKLPGKTLPSNMRRCITQSPGHVELWSFGWTNNYYRKNLYMYPLSGAVFIPYLIYAASQVNSDHVCIDLQPEQEVARVHSYLCNQCKIIPFMTKPDFGGLITKAMSFHPHNDTYRDAFIKLQECTSIKKYK